MTEYDPPGITNPENVDALTHQQINDAFSAIDPAATMEMFEQWINALSLWRGSTERLVQAVRAAVDGNWTGQAADTATTAVVDYCTRADQLTDLFKETSTVAGATANAAVIAKSFLQPVVQVTADQNADPVEYDRQTREAETAQAEARRVMQERYIVPFQDQDSKIPTFPPAVSPVDNGTQEDIPLAGSPSATPSTPGSTQPAPESPAQPGNPGSEPDTTQPAATNEQPSPDPPQSPAGNSNPGQTSSAATTPASAGSPSAATTPASTGSPSAEQTTRNGPGASSSSEPGAPASGGRSTTDPGLGRSGRGSTPVAGPGSQAPSTRPPSPGVSVRPTLPNTPGVPAPAATATGTSPGATTTGTGAAPHGAGAGRAPERDREKKEQEKKVDLQHDRNIDDLVGRTKYVPPTIGS
ncbi:hypothetical protein [Nocardia sp. NPDC050710]|uniref:hypothetical protein n=1 Tax=Nocardia sp. NPDC050710 TaxID=3157220 RepID=UPI00340E0DA4